MSPKKHLVELERVQGNEISSTTNTIHTHINACNTANNNNDKFDNPHHFREDISRLLQQSTIHGLPHLSTSSNNVVRLIWFTLWLAGLAGLFTNLSYVIVRYLSEPVLTSYHEDHEEFIWPDITFCNAMAPYALNTQERQALWYHYVNWARNLSTMNHIPKDLFVSIDSRAANEVMIQSLVHSSIPYWRFNVGNVEDMFIFIAREDIHQGIRLSIKMDVKLTDLSKPWKNYFYTQILQKRYNVPCLSFQIGRYLNKSVTNQIERVLFGIKTNLPSYLIINSSYYQHIIDVYITLPNYFPSTGVIELTPGYIHRVQLEMVRYQRIQKNRRCRDKKYSAIVYDANLMTKRLVYGSDGDLCYRLLSQYLYLQECHCYSPFLPYGYFPDLFKILYNNNNNNTNMKESVSQPVSCLNMSVFNEHELARNSKCMYRVFQRYSNSSLYMSLEKAKRCEYFENLKCCDEVKYNHFGVVSNPLPELWGNAFNEARANFLFNVFRNVTKEISINNSSINISNRISIEYINEIFQDEATRQEILYQIRNNFCMLLVERINPRGRLVLEQDEYPFSRLLSDIGGNMGLWIGISVIGLFELFELIGFIIYSSISYFKRMTMNSLNS